MLDQSWRSTRNVVVNTHYAGLHCDRLLQHGWYRFKDSEMPFGQCIPNYHCGTHVPIWINGTIPKPMDGAVVRMGCGSIGGNCCGFKQEVAVKNCRGYMVYYLTGPAGCSMAYCTGDKYACIGDLYSDTGFGPCVDAYPKLTQAPLLGKPVVTPSGFQFTCWVPYPPNKMDAQFEVTWLIDGQPVSTIPKTILTGSNREALLSGDMLQGHMGSDVSCQVHSRFADNHTGIVGPEIPSNSYWVGIKLSTAHASLNEMKTTEEIHLVSTVPITCGTHAQYGCEIAYIVKLNSTEYFFSSQCVLVLKYTDWNPATSTVSASLHISLKPSYTKFPTSSTFMTLTPMIVGSLGSHLSNVKPMQLLVTTETTSKGAHCSSAGDPHIVTFDHMRTFYNNYRVGQYVMAAKIGGTFRVEARTWQFHKVSANCGVAMREGNDVITIDMCDGGYGHTAPKFEIKNIAMFSNNTDISKSASGDNYVVKFPSGAVVKVYIRRNCLNIHTFVPGDFVRKTEGLCGYFDGNPNNDLMKVDGTIEPHNKFPYNFIESWSIPKGQSLFEKVDPVQIPDTDSCHCTDTQTSSCQQKPPEPAPMAIFCPGCIPVVSGHISVMTSTVTSPTIRTTVIVPHTTTTMATTTTVPPMTTHAPYNFPYVQPTQTPTPTVPYVSTPNASRICYDKLSQYQTGQTCMTDVFKLDIKDIMDMCVSDTELTADPDMALSALSVMMEECGFQALINGSSPGVNQSPLAIVCPGSCSGNGECHNGACTCAKGFEGDSCAVDSRLPPTLNAVVGGTVCKAAKDECLTPALVGENMKPGETLCNIRDITINSDGSKHFNSTSVRTPVIHISSYTVACPLPKDTGMKALKGYIISLTNNGGNLNSHEKYYYVYDAKCLNCDENGNYSLKPNTCNIDNTCYNAGEESPHDQGYCDPVLNNTDWSPSQGSIPTLPLNNHTGMATGCGCYFEPDNYDCACCKNYGCPCPKENKHTCFDCIHPDMCTQHP